jgi:hypothetical protein
MNRFSNACLATAFAAATIALSPLAANAQEGPNADFTPDHIRAQYVAHGYQAEAPVTWWTPNHVTTFRVSDPGSDRVLMILVYPDSATADTERVTAEARDDSSAGMGPHLIAGYGYSTWRGNVALVQSTTDELARQYAVQQAADSQVTVGAAAVETPNPSPTFAVDLDLINVIESGTVNL